MRTSLYGSTGIQFDPTRSDVALVNAVDPGSGAARAGISPGDVVTGVNGQLLRASSGQTANERLFGAAGDKRVVTVRRRGSDQRLVLILAPQPTR